MKLNGMNLLKLKPNNLNKYNEGDYTIHRKIFFGNNTIRFCMSYMWTNASTETIYSRWKF